jgi:hypothetical protein
MPTPRAFRLSRSGLLLALVSAAFAGPAGAAAGRVDFASGGVTVAGTDGRERPLTRGAELDNGDTIRTTDGRAQIRFTDGAYVSLQPNTEFSIKDYRFEGKTDGSESGFFALAKGAMRTVTGLIGRINRNRYRIVTPTATVGIRGTGGVIQVLNDGSTLVVGTSGIWSLTNPAGSIDVPAGVSGLSPSAPDTPPQQTSEQPSAGPAPVTAEPTEFSAGEEQTAEGTPLVVEQAIETKPAFTPLVSGSGYAVRVGHTQFGATISSSNNAAVTFDSSGRMTAAQFGSSFRLEPGGSHVDFGSDGILAWGRWIGPVMLNTDGSTVVNYPQNQGLHYVVGIPTATMPTQGTATYTLLGATKPTYVNTGDTTGPGIFTGGLSVTFGGGTTRLDTVNWNVSMPDRNYAIGNTQISTQSSSFSANASSVSGCAGQCNAFISGFFAGSGAERIGAAYHIQDVVSPNARDILGAAAFKKQ